MHKHTDYKLTTSGLSVHNTYRGTTKSWPHFSKLVHLGVHFEICVCVYTVNIAEKDLFWYIKHTNTIMITIQRFMRLWLKLLFINYHQNISGF